MSYRLKNSKENVMGTTYKPPRGDDKDDKDEK